MDPNVYQVNDSKGSIKRFSPGVCWEAGWSMREEAGSSSKAVAARRPGMGEGTRSLAVAEGGIPEGSATRPAVATPAM